MKKLITILTGTLLLAACRKEAPKQYSYWKVDGVEFSSNEVSLETNQRSITQLIHNKPNNRFLIEFYLPSLPTNGSYLLVKSNTLQETSKCVIGFGFDSKWYRVAGNNNTFLEVSYIDSRSQLKLPPTWYFNNDDASDSVIIEGVFNEP